MILPPITESVDHPDVCEKHGVFASWYDDGNPESGPGEPYMDCPACRDEVEHPMVRCYMCVPLEQRFGDPSGWPLRRTERMSTAFADFDPTTAYHLECGHTVI